jgi:hypothetical protein
MRGRIIYASLDRSPPLMLVRKRAEAAARIMSLQSCAMDQNQNLISVFVRGNTHLTWEKETRNHRSKVDNKMRTINTVVLSLAI